MWILAKDEDNAFTLHVLTNLRCNKFLNKLKNVGLFIRGKIKFHYFSEVFCRSTYTKLALKVTGKYHFYFFYLLNLCWVYYV